MARRDRTGTRTAAGKGTTARATTAQRALHARMADEPAFPRWLVPVLYALVTIALFPEAIFLGDSLLGTDSFALSYFARNFYTEFVQTHHAFPLWNPLMLGGLPFIDGMHGDIFYPPSLMLFFLNAKTMWAWKMILHVFAAGAFTYLWLRRGLKLSRGPAFFGGLVYMMGADLVSLVYPGGDGKLFVSALAPLVFWMAERAVAEKRLHHFAAFALSITLIILTSHMQLAYFCIWGVSLYFLFRVWETWRASRSGGEAARLIGLFALAGVLGVGAAAVQVLPPLAYLREYSQRNDARVEPAQAYAEATSYSLHPEEIVSLVVPEFIGETRAGADPTYWGRNPFKLNHEYAGLIALLLVPVLFFRRRTPRVWFFSGLAVLSLVYAVGATTPLFHLFYLIPGVRLFRAPSLIIFLYGLSLATLGALALERLLEWRAAVDDHRTVTRYFWIATGVLGVLALLASSGALLGFWKAVIYNPPSGGAGQLGPAEMLATNEPRIAVGFWIAFLLSALTAGWWMGTRSIAYNARIAVLLIAGVAAVDLYRVDRWFISSTLTMNRMQDEQGTTFAADESIAFLQQRQAAGAVFRAFDLGLWAGMPRSYGHNDLATHGIEQLGGHHGNEIGRFVKLVGPDGQPDGGLARSNLHMLSTLNVGYILLPQRIQDPQWEEVFVGSRSAVYRNRNVVPRAFLATSIEVTDDATTLTPMQSPDFNGTSPFLTAAITGPVTPQPGAQGGVTWRERGINGSSLEVRTDRPALLVITDNWYPMWKATVDGSPVAVERVNYTFRGIAVPAGTHQVEMHYEASNARMPALVSIVLLLALTGIVVAGMLRDRPDAVGSRDSAESPRGPVGEPA